MSRVLHVKALWATEHDVEVEDGYDPAVELDAVVCDQLDCRHAVLVGFEVES